MVVNDQPESGDGTGQTGQRPTIQSESRKVPCPDRSRAPCLVPVPRAWLHLILDGSASDDP